MNKILLALSLFTLIGTASAHGPYRYGWHGNYGCGGCWIAPAIIGGAIGYELSRPTTVYVEPQPIYTVPQPIVQQPPYGYHWQDMVDPTTNLHKIVLVPN
jgi:hypothetical protein